MRFAFLALLAATSTAALAMPAPDARLNGAYKFDEGGWTYEQPTPGYFVITDPTGTRHHTQSRVVHPRPAPLTPGHGIAPAAPPPPMRGDWTPRRTRATPCGRSWLSTIAARAAAKSGMGLCMVITVICQ